MSLSRTSLITSLGLMLLGVLIGFTGCASTPDNTGQDSRHTLTAFANSNWALTRWNSADGTHIAPGATSPTLHIGYAGRVDGNAGVNRYGTTVSVVADALVWTPASSTRMAGPEEQTQQEERFLADLRATTRVTVRGDKLIFQGEKPLRLEFTRSAR